MAPNAIDSAPVNAPPAMQHGNTRIGSRAANGIAPSEIKHRPNTSAALPPSCSDFSNLRRASNVASPIASGGTIPAAIMAAIGAYTDELSSATPKA
ncbi:hypothetical protein D3C78_1679880 [compost metagenome]